MWSGHYVTSNASILLSCVRSRLAHERAHARAAFGGGGGGGVKPMAFFVPSAAVALADTQQQAASDDAGAHSQWAAADVPASGAEAGSTGAAPLSGEAARGSVSGSGWHGDAGGGGEQSARAGGRAAQPESNGASAGHGDAWGRPQGGSEPAAVQWQPPPETGGVGAAGQASASAEHSGLPETDHLPYGGMSFGSGGYGVASGNGAYGSSPLQLSPPTVPEPGVAFGAEAGPAANDWQPGAGPGTGSAITAEDEMVELDF